MGCSTCGGGGSVTTQNRSTNIKKQSVSTDFCSYTEAILNRWYDKLVWFKSTALYIKYNIKASTINKYLGIVLSSINMNNKCYFKDNLDEMTDTINLIASLQ